MRDSRAARHGRASVVLGLMMVVVPITARADDPRPPTSPSERDLLGRRVDAHARADDETDTIAPRRLRPGQRWRAPLGHASTSLRVLVSVEPGAVASIIVRTRPEADTERQPTAGATNDGVEIEVSPGGIAVTHLQGAASVPAASREPLRASLGPTKVEIVAISLGPRRLIGVWDVARARRIAAFVIERDGDDEALEVYASEAHATGVSIQRAVARETCDQPSVRPMDGQWIASIDPTKPASFPANGQRWRWVPGTELAAAARLAVARRRALRSLGLSSRWDAPLSRVRHILPVDAWIAAANGITRVQTPSPPAGGASPRAESLGPGAWEGWGPRIRGGIVDMEALWCSGAPVTSIRTEPALSDRSHALWLSRLHGPTRDASGRWRLDDADWDALAVEELLTSIAADAPALTHLEVIGTSARGHPIWAMRITRRGPEASQRPSVFLNAAHHGNEIGSTEIALDAITTLVGGAGHDRAVDAILDGLQVWIVPLVNPDGRQALIESSLRTGRKNGADADGDGHAHPHDGVDLNRNYPYHFGSLGERGSKSEPRSHVYRGPAAASEPEVQAILALADRERFVASLSIHTGTVALLAPYTIDDAPSPTPNEAWTVAEEVLARLPAATMTPPIPLLPQLYSVDGTDQDWHRHAHGTLALLLEATHRSPRTPADRAALRERMRPLWIRLFVRFLEGPSIHGVVVDAQGVPVAAPVHIDEILTHDGERWWSRCRDGSFARYLPGPGTYTLRVDLDDGSAVRTRVRVRRAREAVEIRLPQGAALPPRSQARCGGDDKPEETASDRGDGDLPRPRDLRTRQVNGEDPAVE